MGGRNLKSPTGGAAYGIPRNTSTRSKCRLFNSCNETGTKGFNTRGFRFTFRLRSLPILKNSPRPPTSISDDFIDLQQCLHVSVLSPRFCRGFYRFHPTSWDSFEIDKHELSFPLFFDRPFAQVPSKIRSDASLCGDISLSLFRAHGSPGGKNRVTDSQIERES